MRILLGGGEGGWITVYYFLLWAFLFCFGEYVFFICCRDVLIEPSWKKKADTCRQWSCSTSTGGWEKVLRRELKSLYRYFDIITTAKNNVDIAAGGGGGGGGQITVYYHLS